MFLNLTPDDLDRIIQLLRMSQMNRSDARLIEYLQSVRNRVVAVREIDLDEIPF